MGRSAAAVADDDAGQRLGILQRLGWSHRDAVGFVVGVFAIAMILFNVLFRQSGPHPAPIVRSGVVSTAPAPAPGPMLASTSTGQPRPRQIEIAAPKADMAKTAPPAAVPAPAARPNADIVLGIQRELSRRGFYDGPVDGRYGPRTDTAIRDFEQAAALRPSAQPNEELLRAISRSPVRSRPSPPSAARRSTGSTPPARPDPIGELLTPSTRIMAVQRALSEFGYGQINPSGVVDTDTQRAIERFERERRLPVTGQLSHRVVRELAGITGRPLE